MTDREVLKWAKENAEQFSCLKFLVKGSEDSALAWIQLARESAPDMHPTAAIILGATICEKMEKAILYGNGGQPVGMPKRGSAKMHF